VPEPVAVIVTAVPETLAANAIGLLVPVSTRPKVPEAVIVLLIVMPPLALSVKLTAAPVEAPLPVKA